MAALPRRLAAIGDGVGGEVRLRRGLRVGEVRRLDRVDALAQILGRARDRDAAVVHDVDAVGDVHRLVDVLLDEQHARALVGRRCAAPRTGDRRSSARVPWTARRPARPQDCATARVRARASAADRRTAARPTVEMRLELREQFDDRLACGAEHAEVLGDRHAREDGPGVGDERESGAGALVQRRVAVEAEAVHRSAERREVAGQREECRGLAGAVRSEQRDDLALVDLEIDVADDRHLAVAGRRALRLEQRGHEVPISTVLGS